MKNYISEHILRQPGMADDFPVDQINLTYEGNEMPDLTPTLLETFNIEDGDAININTNDGS